MAHDWFIVRDGKEQGPITAQQLKQMAATGKLQPDDKVRRSDMQAASKASTIKGLFAQVEPAPTKSPPSATATAPPAPQKKSVPSKKTVILASVVGGACLLLCCGGFAIFGLKMQDKSRTQLAEADALWDKGDKAGAVGKYRAILDEHRATFLKDEDRPRVYGRVIDADAENGNMDSAKKLLADAIEHKVKPLVSHPEAKALLAAEEARAAREQASTRGETLTADFYPFKPGTVQQTTGTLYLGTKQSQWRKEYAYEGNGVIKVRCLKHFIPGGASLPLLKPTQLQRREKDGFVEIGEENGVTQQVEWRPLLKIGALAGDQWERELSPGVKESYKVTKFGTEEVALKGGGSKEKLAVAFVEVRTTTTLPSGKAIENMEEIHFGRGVGPVYRKSWRVENGNRELNWSENMVPVLKE